MQNKSGKISIREKICYGLGDSSANIFFGMTMMFLPYFYTDVVGLTAGAMGTLFLIARLVDAFSELEHAYLLDHAHSLRSIDNRLTNRQHFFDLQKNCAASCGTTKAFILNTLLTYINISHF